MTVQPLSNVHENLLGGRVQTAGSIELTQHDASSKLQ